MEANMRVLVRILAVEGWSAIGRGGGGRVGENGEGEIGRRIRG